MARGGKRKNAGRPALMVGRTQDYAVRLPVSTANYLRKLGNGSLSIGIQKIVDKLLGGTE